MRSLDDGTVVFGADADALLNPASNVKLVTAAAALARLGVEYRFDTEFLIEPGMPVERHPSTLCVRGKGDPTSPPSGCYGIASELQHVGVREITGDFCSTTATSTASGSRPATTRRSCPTGPTSLPPAP